MKVKEIDRTVNVSWSPAVQHPILLAAGTAAQQLDASFSTTAALEVYALNLAEPGLDMELRASVPSDNRFHKVAWGNYGFGREHNNGVIVGGCDGGHVQIYSAAKLLAGEEGLVAKKDKHTGPVRALDFNPYQSNLLATGASESEILIWDLNNMDTPMLPGAKSQPADDVLWISWNRQVQHILASTFAPRCVMWDLRKNEPIIKLSDSTSRIRWKVVAWHPEVATQLCLASEEDQTPVIQLWDLRFATSPLKVLENHQRGVLSIAWCPQDPDLLVSCGKDNRILCWNPNSNVPGGEVVCDIATSNQWNFDVSWCPRNPALIASASFDGHVSVYSLTGGQQQVQTSTKIADSFPGMETYVQAPVPQQQQLSSVDLRKAPKWLRRPVGASFGFGGKLVSFGHEVAQPAQNGVVSHVVYVSQVVTEPDLIARSSQLETTLQYGQYSDFCQAKATSSPSSHERSVWNFVQANFNSNPRAEILTLLGFKPDEINMKLGRYIGKPANARPPGDLDSLSDRVATLGRDVPEGDASATFDAIAASATSQTNLLEKSPIEPFRILTGDDTEGLICQALLLGNTEAAVEMCMQNGRMADAIILAMTGGSDLLARTQFRYFQQSKGYLSTMISAVVTEDWSQVMQSCEVDSWKEALAAALTYTKNEELPVLCEQLGSRLEAEGRGSLSLNAQLCYICAGNLNKLVESWSATEKLDSPDKLQQLVELAMLLRKAVEQQGRTVEVSGKLANLLSRYAALLAAQGNLTAALTYLQNSQDEQMVMLHDRLYKALGLTPAYPQQQQQQQTAAHPHSRQSATRQSIGSFQPKPQTVASSYRPGFSTPSVQPTPGLYPVQQQQTPAAKPFGGQSTFPPAPVAKPVMQPFAAPVPAQPYQPYTTPTQPPASVTPQPGGVNATSRKPYVIDPSVQTGPQYSAMPQAGYNRGPMQQFQPTPAATMYPSAEAYNPAENMNTQPIVPVPSIPSVNAPPGWNDPPVLKNTARNQAVPHKEHVEMSAEHAGTRKWKSLLSHKPKSEYMPPNPITHPLYGAAPQEAAPMAMNGGYVDPLVAAPYQQQPQVYQPMPQQQQQQQQQVMPLVAPAKVAEPPKPKGPIPEEHMYLQTVFEELRSRCTCAANNPQLKRKLEEVARKLESLYDALREHKLSPNTLQGLHQIVQMVQIGDYTGGLGLHTQLVSGPDFSQIASFMPGLKVLMQSALQLGVYLQ